MNFIKKVFDGKSDESVHLQFQKFSRGEFKDKALINAKKTGNKYTISTSAEFANEFVKIMAEKLGNRESLVRGVIVSTQDLTGKIDFRNKKQFMGIKQYTIDKEMSGDEIVGLLKRFPKAFFALSFGYGTEQLKIKPKAPKSSKPSNKGETLKPNFCKFMTEDPKIAKAFIFEKPDFKQAEITHTFLINDLILPEREEDYANVREMAKRKGKIIREAVIDGKTLIDEKEFVA